MNFVGAYRFTNGEGSFSAISVAKTNWSIIGAELEHQ